MLKLCFFFEELRPLGGCHDQTKVLEKNSLFAAKNWGSPVELKMTLPSCCYYMDNMLPLEV